MTPAATHLVNLVWSERLRFAEGGSDDNSNMLAALQDAKVRQNGFSSALSVLARACLTGMEWGTSSILPGSLLLYDGLRCPSSVTVETCKHCWHPLRTSRWHMSPVCSLPFMSSTMVALFKPLLKCLKRRLLMCCSGLGKLSSQSAILCVEG